jgi:uncharacterized protein with HEPN domain
VPWRSIRGMRNVLAHAYFEVDLNLLWKAVQEDIPVLIKTLEQEVDDV